MENNEKMQEEKEDELPKLENEKVEETMMSAGVVGKDDDMEELANQLAISSPFMHNPPLQMAFWDMEKQEHHRQQQDEKKAEAGLRCPRCESTDTKFCYFNNYSLSQPRHFCRACKRSWTRGGALRDVPARGGGGRKNKGRVIHPSSSES